MDEIYEKTYEFEDFQESFLPWKGEGILWIPVIDYSIGYDIEVYFIEKELIFERLQGVSKLFWR